MKKHIYSAREFSEKELTSIRQIIAASDKPNRAEISRRVCREIDWYRPNGQLKEMSCRNVLLKMQNDGLIQLPQPIRGNGNKFRHLTPKKTAAGETQELIDVKLGELLPIKIQPVCKDDASLWNELMHRYHYLGYSALVGNQMRYLVRDRHERVIAALGFSGAAWAMEGRDKWIGWDSSRRKENLDLIVNNSRFLILPWVKCKNLASHTLAKVAKQLPCDWQKKYATKPLLMETLVEDARFQGTCYKAANWIYLAKTKGRGKYDTNTKCALPVKSIFVYPLCNSSKKLLIGGGFAE